MSQEYGVGVKVEARKYQTDREPDLIVDGKTRVGTVVTTPDDADIPRTKTIPVQWEGVEGVRFYAASNLKLVRDNGAKADQGGRTTSKGGPKGAGALNPDAAEISDEDVEAMRSLRQRLIGHMLTPTDPEFGGDEAHDHGKQERAESTIKSASVSELKVWHRNAHGVLQGDPHEL